MSRTTDPASQFDAHLLPLDGPGDGDACAFVVLPKAASDALPRRGRTSVDGTINGRPFRALLEPDGRKSHWLRIDQSLLDQSGAAVGDVARFEVAPVAPEPDPAVPPDLDAMLRSCPAATATWRGTTPVARVDWVHWVESAKQPATRRKRIADAREMLAAGKKRVCCFDPSGFYSKAFRAPPAAE